VVQRLSENTSKPFVTSPFVKKMLDLFDYLRLKNSEFGAVSCALIMGESGSGKSAIAERYLAKNPRVEEEERTRIPVFYYEFKTVNTPKDFYTEALLEIGDPSLRSSRETASDLRRKLNKLIEVTKVELIILDEIQVFFEGRSRAALPGLADVFKDLIKDSAVPVVFMGMPYSKYLFEANEQLRTRVSHKHLVPVYKASTKAHFNDYRRLLKMLGKAHQVSDIVSLEEVTVAFRIFCHTRGNLRATAELISDFKIDCQIGQARRSIHGLGDVIKNLGCSDSQNPFLVPKEKLRLSELVTHTDYLVGARPGAKAVVDAEYTEFGVTEDNKLYNLVSGG